MNVLALRLWGYLTAVHSQWRLKSTPFDVLLDASSDVLLHSVSKTGVVGFSGDYVMAAWPPNETAQAACRAVRLIIRRVETHGFVLYAVYPLNARSVIATRKIGAVPLGVDEDGFVHYRLDRKHGQAESTKAAGPHAVERRADSAFA